MCAVMTALCLTQGAATAQSGGSLSAAAEAYDRGTAAYLDGSYAKAAQWFETANRLAPAAPALMQAVRAHHKAGNSLKASSLALQLKLEYGAEPAAVQFAESILEENAAQYVQVQVQCTDCSLAVDGGVQEYPAFFVEPDVAHTIAATFPTGTVSEELNAAAGENRELAFEAPPPPPVEQEQEKPPAFEGTSTPASKTDTRSGLTPVVFFVGAGITVGLAVGSLVTGLGTRSAVDDYEKAADASNSCGDDPDCSPAEYQRLRDAAEVLLDDANGKRTVRNVLFVATGVFAAATATVGIFFTDWKGNDEDDEQAGIDFDVAPLPGGAFATLKGRF